MRPRVPEEAFSRRRAYLLAGFGVSTLLLTLLVSATVPGDLDEPSPYSDTFSKSAVGHEALMEVLRKLGIPAERSRFKTAERAARASLLVLAEPTLGEYSPNPGERSPDELFDAMIEADAPVLVVLPKWDAARSLNDEGHIDGVTEIHPSLVARVLERADVKGSIRVADRAECRGAMIMNLELRDVQLIVDSDLHPIVRCGDGILVGEVDPDAALSERRVFVSDPDIIATHGLKHGGAQLSVALIEDLRRDDNAVLFDEVLHGFRHIPSVYQEALTFPLALVTFNVLLAIIFVVWAAFWRFGAPLGAGDDEQGRRLLIDQEAGLLRGGRSAVESLVRYRHIVQSQVSTALGAPKSMTMAQARQWLLTAAERRGQRATIDDYDAKIRRLETLAYSAPRKIKNRDVIAVTHSLNAWKNEMLNG